MESLPPIDHGFTHFDLRLQPLRVRCTPPSKVREADGRIWYALNSPPKVGLPRPIHQLFERMLNTRAVA
jgi:A/G-specific adenine glycosylase